MSIAVKNSPSGNIFFPDPLNRPETTAYDEFIPQPGLLILLKGYLRAQFAHLSSTDQLDDVHRRQIAHGERVIRCALEHSGSKT